MVRPVALERFAPDRPYLVPPTQPPQYRAILVQHVLVIRFEGERQPELREAFLDLPIEVVEGTQTGVEPGNLFVERQRFANLSDGLVVPFSLPEKGDEQKPGVHKTRVDRYRLAELRDGLVLPLRAHRIQCHTKVVITDRQARAKGDHRLKVANGLAWFVSVQERNAQLIVGPQIASVGLLHFREEGN